MGIDIPAFFGARRKARVGTHQSYGVTPLGKKKAEEFALSGPRWKVLAYIAEEGPCSVSEVEKEAGMGTDKAKLILRGLLNDGYIQAVSQGE